MTRREDGRWQEAIVIDGKRKYFYGKTKAEVFKKIKEYDEKRISKTRFEAVAEAWQEEHFKEIIPSTARGYKASIKRALKEFSGSYVEEITPGDIQGLIRKLIAQKFGKKTVSTQLNVLNMIFNFAILQGCITSNPCSAIRVPQGLPAKRREMPSEEDLKKVNDSDWLFPFFILYTGCRRGEALAMTYEDIDWEKKVIHINKAVGYDDSVPYIKTPKTEAGKRSVVLLDALAARLKKGRGLIFPNSSGGLYTDTQIFRAWENWQKENDTNVTAHQLRHAYATILFDAGLEVKDAQALLGHSTIAMTQDVYTHIRNSRREATAEKLNNFVNMMSK